MSGKASLQKNFKAEQTFCEAHQVKSGNVKTLIRFIG